MQDLKVARQAFEANEPRDLFYRAATELVELALDGKITLTVAEALRVLSAPFGGSAWAQSPRLPRDEVAGSVF